MYKPLNWVARGGYCVSSTNLDIHLKLSLRLEIKIISCHQHALKQHLASVQATGRIQFHPEAAAVVSMYHHSDISWTVLSGWVFYRVLWCHTVLLSWEFVGGPGLEHPCGSVIRRATGWCWMERGEGNAPQVLLVSWKYVDITTKAAYE